MKKKLIDYVDTIKSDPDILITQDIDLIDSGILDSLAIVQLISFIEEEFKIEFKDEDFEVKNFKTISSILALVETQQVCG